MATAEGIKRGTLPNSVGNTLIGFSLRLAFSEPIMEKPCKGKTNPVNRQTLSPFHPMGSLQAESSVCL
jgi:hypothetical protein